MFDELPSTNDYLKENYRSLRDHFPVMVNADLQTRGRGRNDRSWHSARGLGVYATFGVDISDPGLLPFLAIASGIASAETLKGLSGLEFLLKWPNDVLVNGKKIAGVLVENIVTGESAVSLIGIGINVNQQSEDFPPELGERAISLRMATGKVSPIDEIRARLARCFFGWLDRLERGRSGDVIVEADRLSRWLVGKPISFHDGNRVKNGVFVGIDPGGGAVIEQEPGDRAVFYSGEISEHVVKNLNGEFPLF
jgi:BirA family biotin operon repressor/biotin-[acetyl-CoA-carboxylase] ligase